MPSPIVTSIPPIFSRKDAGRREIGEAYLARCVQSWRGDYDDTVAPRIRARLPAQLIPRSCTHLRRVLRAISQSNTAVLDRIAGTG